MLIGRIAISHSGLSCHLVILGICMEYCSTFDTQDHTKPESIIKS